MISIIKIAVASAALLTGPVMAENHWPACGEVDRFPASQWQLDPQGWDATALERAHTLFEAGDADSVMIVHRGRLVAAWGPVSDRLTIQSMRKPVLSSMIGQMVAEGRLSLDDTLADLDIDDTPPLAPGQRQATLRDLLLARSGIMRDANYEVGGWRRLRVEWRETGQARLGRWFYNNWDFNALGTIAERAGGEGLGPMFVRRIADPLGMQDFRAEDVGYSGRDSLAQQHFGYGSDHPAYMFEMSSRDLARFGLLYLACGRWEGHGVVPEDWVLDSIRGVDITTGPDDPLAGTGDRFGYLWWVEDGGQHARFPELRDLQPFYLASGYRGHFLLVMPGFDLVIVHQPRTIGGIGDAAQIARAREGSPEVSETEFADLVRAILAAHPDRN